MSYPSSSISYGAIAIGFFQIYMEKSYISVKGGKSSVNEKLSYF